MRYSIREANAEDHKALNELFAAGDRFHREALPHLFQESAGLARPEEFLSGIMTGEDSAMFVAEYERQVVALINVLVKETPAIPILKPRRYAVVEDLYVMKSVLRQGIGRVLVEAAGRWASCKAATEMELNVWEFNQGAMAFYDHPGFSTWSRKMAVSLSR
ncbi:MAG: GNAT family N-acetyltransferase [Dehalococcoidia bacterium]|nr:GNAT family N-acetyltransferase [Dehalococcoidia bacterium]